MKWKTWQEIGWMEKKALITAAQAIPAPAPVPEETQEPHWKSDESKGGQVRDNLDGAEVLTSQDTIGHQRPA